MEKANSRRVALSGGIAAAGVGVLIFFELLVMCGALEIKSSTLARYVPWAYEPFLRLVGEHPDSIPEPKTSAARPEKNARTDIGTIPGFSQGEIKVDLDVDVPDHPEPDVQPPVEGKPAPEPVKDPKDTVPVG